MAVLTPKENLQLAYERSCAALAEFYLKPRPDESVDGASYQWNALRKSLLDEQAGLLAALQAADGPFSVDVYPLGS